MMMVAERNEEKGRRKRKKNNECLYNIRNTRKLFISGTMVVVGGGMDAMKCRMQK